MKTLNRCLNNGNISFITTCIRARYAPEDTSEGSFLPAANEIYTTSFCTLQFIDDVSNRDYNVHPCFDP